MTDLTAQNIITSAYVYSGYAAMVFPDLLTHKASGGTFDLLFPVELSVAERGLVNDFIADINSRMMSSADFDLQDLKVLAAEYHTRGRELRRAEKAKREQANS